MEPLFQKMKQLPEHDLPFDISQAVMRRIALQRIKLPLSVAGFLLVQLAALCFSIYYFLLDTGSWNVLKALGDGFDLSWSYTVDAWQGLVETMPVTQIGLLIVTAIVLAAMIRRLYRLYRHSFITMSISF